VQLEEDRLMAYTHFTIYHAHIKNLFDIKTKGKKFQVGDMVFLWDKKNKKSGDHGKFDNLWLGPYIIYSSIGTNTFQLVDLEGELIRMLVNGKNLHFLFQ
jgi:hypothetical protein